MRKTNKYSSPETEVVEVKLEAAILSKTKDNNSTEEYEVQNVDPFNP